MHAAANRGRRELADRSLALVRYDAHPGVARAEQSFDFAQRNVPIELDRQRLAMAAHRPDAHADALDDQRVGLRPEDLIGFDSRLPFLATLACTQILVDPRDQIAGKRDSEMRARELRIRERET